MSVELNGTSATDYAHANIPTREASRMSQSQTLTPSRGGTLKKRASVKAMNNLSRSSSKRRSYAGSVRSLSRGVGDGRDADVHNAFHTPIPTKGSPTELLAERFAEWRKVLKDLLVYFKEAQKAHESKSKSLEALSRIVQNTPTADAFMSEGGIGEGASILRKYHKQAVAENQKAKQVEEDIVVQLTGLRNDLAQKIKEIKSLSSDFSNKVDKEQDKTRDAVRNLQESIKLEETHPDTATGKGDPFLVRLAVERQLERQIDEENYLHQAFLNLESSGRELESIVVGEIQKAYSAYAGIMKREADEQYEVIESLKEGPLAMPRVREWEYFLDDNPNFVDPKMAMRKPETIDYPGKDAPAAAEVRSGMLERKSKYLKSYTPGWYVLSPTHLHEFKSQDRLASQQPVMSLRLSEQKLGNHSGSDSGSHKFILKGRQSGGMHRGHGWTFRAESYDTMLAWYEDIKSLTEKTGEERNAYVRRHARSLSSAGHYSENGGRSGPGSVSSGDINDDEADEVPYSMQSSVQGEAAFSTGVDGAGGRAGTMSPVPQRPVPGGRFPSDIDVSRHLHSDQRPRNSSDLDNDSSFLAVTQQRPTHDRHQTTEPETHERLNESSVPSSDILPDSNAESFERVQVNVSPGVLRPDGVS